MTTREITSSPGIATTYARAVLGSILRKQGDYLPALELVKRSVCIDRAHLAAYNRVCGFAQRDTLPGTYPFVLAFAQQMDIITDPTFPFPAMGLVHLQNRIHQHRPIHVSETLTLRVRAANLRPHAKGLQFDILITLGPDDDDVVWESVSTSLRRQAGTGGDGAPRAKGTTTATEPGTGTEEHWTIPADTGRRYASASGDRNPIHLTALTAKLFGFPRAVAHGMWLKARCLAALDAQLPDAYHLDVQFKTPVLMPTRVVFQSTAQEGESVDFSLRAASNGKPHLVGTLVPQKAQRPSLLCELHAPQM
jgi:acyl dehydratase